MKDSEHQVPRLMCLQLETLKCVCPERMRTWNSLASLKLDELVSRRPASKTTQALSKRLLKESRVQAWVLDRLRAFANI